MSKASLIEGIKAHAEFEFTNEQCSDIVDVISKVIKDELIKEKETFIPGIGRFILTKRAAKKGRNPQTGESITIPEANVVRFKAFKPLKDAIKDLKF